MKIVMTAPYYYPKIGGLENYARQLALGLQAEGAEVVLVASNHESRRSRVDTVDGMKIYRLGRWFKLFNTPVNPLWSVMLRRIIRREKPDVVATHSPVPTMADATVLAAGKTPVVLFYHAASLAKKNAPVFNLIAKCYGVYQSFTFRRATVIAAVSDYVVTCLPTRYQSKAIVVPNAVWNDEITAAVTPQSPNRFVFVASLDRTHAWKGLDAIIEAFALHKKTTGRALHLDVIGDGDHRAYYEQKVRTLDVADEITFLGALRGEAKNIAMARARALICYPSSPNDAFPTVMLEAWSLGVVVVAGAIGPLPSLIGDGADGILVPADDPSALAEALDRVAKFSRPAVARMTRAAALRTSTDYTWEVQARRVKKMMEALA